MTQAELQRCLDLLRQADAILLRQRELALAAHLSLVIERLADRLVPR